MTRTTPKSRLLDAVIAHFAADGLADQSLRRIAEAVGTSHRMLLYHFGSKDGLLLAVVREVEARTQAQLAAASATTGDRTDELIRRMWAYVADPALGDFERLFFALYGRALQGDEATRPLVKDEIERWLAVQASLARRAGVPEELARPHARLGLAVTRGLLLDLLATGDRAGVDAALDAFARGYGERFWERANPTHADPTRSV
ncbi:MAG TPA: TetR/AcrR family transcriptional regulator [Acidimicrobiales bacterium]|jgi:AcrR family transcriptional regulator|nr:TetR/AcrR family transcriptional regulator [Acidimicrobiales bacterium]